MYEKDENSEARFFARMYSRMMMFPTFERVFSGLRISDEQKAVKLVHMVDTVLSIESLTHFKMQLLNIKRLGVQHRGRTRPGDFRLFGDILLSTLVEMYGPRRITPTIVKAIKKTFNSIGEVMQQGQDEHTPASSGSEMPVRKKRSRRKSMGDLIGLQQSLYIEKKERPLTGQGQRTRASRCRNMSTRPHVQKAKASLKRYRSKSGMTLTDIQDWHGQSLGDHKRFIEEMKQEKERALAKARREKKRKMQRPTFEKFCAESMPLPPSLDEELEHVMKTKNKSIVDAKMIWST